MKTVLLIILALLMLAAPGAAEATTVSIQMQKTGFTSVTATPTVTFTDHTGKPAVALACDTAANAATPAPLHGPHRQASGGTRVRHRRQGRHRRRLHAGGLDRRHAGDDPGPRALHV